MSLPFTVKVLGAGEEGLLSCVADGVFDNPVDPRLSAEFLNDPRHHIAVAIEAGLVVGFASGVDYIHPDKPRELWINEVGVAPSHRRRGVGHAVLAALLESGRKLGCSSAWVLTDQSNNAAIALYRSLGGATGIEGASEAIVGFEFKFVGEDPTHA